MAARIRKGDKVTILAGRDKGKIGEVLKVDPAANRVVVQGVNVVKRHQRPTPMDPGGIKNFEAPIHVSNVAHIDPKSNEATRIGFKVEDGKKVRFAKKSGEVIDG